MAEAAGTWTTVIDTNGQGLVCWACLIFVPSFRSLQQSMSHPSRCAVCWTSLKHVDSIDVYTIRLTLELLVTASKKTGRAGSCSTTYCQNYHTDNFNTPGSSTLAEGASWIVSVLNCRNRYPYAPQRRVMIIRKFNKILSGREKREGDRQRGGRIPLCHYIFCLRCIPRPWSSYHQ